MTTLSVQALGCLMAVLTTLPAMADQIRIGEPGFGGNGCPEFSARAALSPDQKQLSILFDAFSVEAGGQSGRRTDYKTCGLAIPVHVPQGISIAVFQADYRGATMIPYGGVGTFEVGYYFVGGTGPTIRRVLTGPTNDEFLFTDLLRNEQLVWSPCGTDTVLRVDTSFKLETNAAHEHSMAMVDSLDLTAGLVYQLMWKRCTPPPSTQPPGPRPPTPPVPPPPPPRPNPDPEKIVKAEKTLRAFTTNGDGWKLSCPSGYRVASTSWSGGQTDKLCEFKKSDSSAVLKCDQRVYGRFSKDITIKYSVKCVLI